MKDKIDDLTAATKDGLPITVRDIQLGFRLISDEEIEKKGSQDHGNRDLHFTQALIRLIYYRPTSGDSEAEQDTLKIFKDAVKGVVKGKIRDYINERQVDNIIFPSHQRSEPRQEIARQLLSAETRERFAQVGAKLLWVDVGNFDLEERAENQRLNIWKAGWAGKAKVTSAHGEAHKLASRELGRAEAQAEILSSILHGLEDVDPF